MTLPVHPIPAGSPPDAPVASAVCATGAVIPAVLPTPDAPAASAPLGGRGAYLFVDGRYVSPIPAEVVADYRARTPDGPTHRRIHMFPRPGGGACWCDPDYCRECWREKHLREPEGLAA